LTLLILSNWVQLILVLLIGFLNSDQVSISFTFVFSYLIAENFQVLFLIALADLLIKLSWKLSTKPESNVPALMSTLSDFSGTLVLVAVFYALKQTGKLEIPALNVVEKVTQHAAEILKEIATTATTTTSDSL